MTDQKIKYAFAYRALVTGNVPLFPGLIEQLASLPSTDLIVTYSDGYSAILGISIKESVALLTLQSLKSSDLPKIANTTDGKNEQFLSMPAGKSLSYKNLFVYDLERNILFMTRLRGYPGVWLLSDCLKRLIRTHALATGRFNIRFTNIFETGLADKLRSAKNITAAEFTATGDTSAFIKPKDLERYKEYLAGRDYSRKVSISGLRGSSIKHLIQFILDEYIANQELPWLSGVKMTIDGAEVDFNRYFKKYPIDDFMDSQNNRYIDYDKLARELIRVMRKYTNGQDD